MEASYEVSGSNLFFSNDKEAKSKNNTKSNINTVLLTGLSFFYLGTDIINNFNLDNIKNQNLKQFNQTSGSTNFMENEHLVTNTLNNGIVSIHNKDEEEGFIMSSNFVTDKALDQTEKYFDSKLDTTNVKLDNLQISIDKIDDKFEKIATLKDIELLEEKMKNSLHRKTWTILLGVPTLISIIQYIVNNYF